MRGALTTATLAMAMALATPVPAADNMWAVDTAGGTSASVANAAGNLNLIVGCVAPNVALALSGSGVDVDTGGEFTVKVGNKTWPVIVGSGRAALLLNNLPDGAAGITDDLYAALRTGKAVELGGSAFATAPAADLSFSLDGSGAALKSVKDACGAGVVPPLVR